jgi:hypothetical protein
MHWKISHRFIYTHTLEYRLLTRLNFKTKHETPLEDHRTQKLSKGISKSVKSAVSHVMGVSNFRDFTVTFVHLS